MLERPCTTKIDLIVFLVCFVNGPSWSSREEKQESSDRSDLCGSQDRRGRTCQPSALHPILPAVLASSIRYVSGTLDQSLVAQEADVYLKDDTIPKHEMVGGRECTKVPTRFDFRSQWEKERTSQQLDLCWHGGQRN